MDSWKTCEQCQTRYHIDRWWVDEEKLICPSGHATELGGFSDTPPGPGESDRQTCDCCKGKGYTTRLERSQWPVCLICGELERECVCV